MTEKTSALLDGLATKFGGVASISTVYGDPIEREGVTIVPVARVSVGFGGGTGIPAKEPERGGRGGGGGGGGAAVTPIGYIEIKRGRAVFRQIRHPMKDLFIPVLALLVGSALPRVQRRLQRSRRRRG